MVNVKRLRCFIGFLAIGLPWIVLLLHGGIPPSISATYYDSRASTAFIGVLTSASILLMYYDGYDLADDILNTSAGIAGIAICLFPCSNYEFEYVGTFRISPHVSGIIHNISAVVFFGILTYVSAFQFTKTNGVLSKKKKKRNAIYRICACGMIASFLLFLLPDFNGKIWLIEMFALTFFGLSWLTKANAYKLLFAEGENGT